MISVDDATSAIGGLRSESSSADPLPVYVVKSVAGELAPFLLGIFNRSLAAGHFLETFIEGSLRRQSKSLVPGLDSTDVRLHSTAENTPHWFYY